MIIGKCLHEKCARNRNRTGTTVKSRDFKSLVSTYFTIRAEGEHYTHVTRTPHGLGEASKEKGKVHYALSLCFGAGEESLTLDLYLGKVSLYQLSYSRKTLEARAGVEPTYTDLQSGA